MDQHKTDDNLRYVGGLTRVLAANASISFAGQMVKLAEFCGYSVDLRCQLSDEGFQNADAGGDCEKNKDEDDFSFTCTNLDGSPISTDDIFQNGQIRPVFPIFNHADYDNTSRARGVAASSSSLRSPLKSWIRRPRQRRFTTQEVNSGPDP
ncbi:uncharacterized protein LOC110754274 [Prunus avium]|uniref:Uncharacterized protein LOC110754274 n=1 Tax=Prunus avium TaxID=42229 RepID=A0A6P5SBU7_PRUAV|nr:uncharacterized protein LOC110754274 [Prunus avium]